MARAYIFCPLVPWRRHYVPFGERLSVGVLLLIKWHIYAPRCRIFLWISLHLIYHQFIPWNVIRRKFYYHPNSRASRVFWVFFFLSTHSKFILRTNATEFLPRSREYLDSPGWNVHSWMLKITHFTIDVTISHHSSILWSGFPWVVREIREGAVILFPHFSMRQQCWAQWWASSTRICSHPFTGI